MKTSSIILALALVAGTVPTIGAALADVEAPATPAATNTPNRIQDTRATLDHAVEETDPTVDDGLVLADTVLGVQQDRLDERSPAGLADVLEEHLAYLDRIRSTVSLIHTEADLSAAVDASTPSQAVTDLAERTDVRLSADQQNDVQRLDDLPSPWPSHLAAWIHAFNAFHATTETALADVPGDAEHVTTADVVEQIRSQRDQLAPSSLDLSSWQPRLVEYLTDEEIASILDARDAFLTQTLSIRELAQASRPAGEPDVQACPVLAVGLANEDTTYEEDCRLILDLGGSDTYENNAGGAWTKVSADEGCLITGGDNRTPGFKAAALVDLGGREDVYGDVEDPRACGVNGGASQGSGFLLDDGGSDFYIAGGPSSYGQGAVNIGTATLIDLGGNDVYRGSTYANAQAFAGSGLLYDASGDDEYIAGSYANGAGGGGQAALVDAGGDDRYSALRASNGAGVLPGGALLLDISGSDTYEGTDTGTNGGAWAGSGLLVDILGDDDFLATGTGTNGGGELGGSGTLVNLGGNDVYEAGSDGTNGGGSFGGQGLVFDDRGADRYVAGTRGANGGGSLGAGLLLDGAGHDMYEDRQGGTGTNTTVAPKGQVGAQIDAPHTPSQPEQPPEPPTEEAPNPQPHVIVGDPDSGINPYHEIYQRPGLTEHPCTYIPDFPCDIPALNLTLDAPDLGTALEEDLDVWKNVTVGQWYWIPGTSIVAASCSDDGPPCLLQCSIGEIEADRDPNCSSGEHGTHTSSTILMENPDALIAFRETAGRISAFEDRGIPVDLYSVSYGSLLPAPLPAHTACPGQQQAPLYVTSAGNTPYSTFNSCRKGDPGKISAGGAYAEDRTEEGDATKNPEVVSYYCRPTADDDTIDRYETACGTSFSAPTVAGALSKTILEVRQHTGYTGNIDGQMLDPAYGEDGLTVGDLREAMNRTATYDPTPRYDNTDTTGSVPLNPIAPWVQWGWGFYDADNAEKATDHLLGEEPADPRPLPVRAWMEAQHTVKTGLYEDRT